MSFKALGKVAAASDIELYIEHVYSFQDNHELLCSLFDYVDTHILKVRLRYAWQKSWRGRHAKKEKKHL